MINFFRKIRRNLLAEGKVSKYLKYAIGEIILVVVGILIALQINNWNEYRKSREVELNYLKNIQEDILSDSLYFERSWFKRGDKKIQGLNKAKNYYLNGIIPTDTITFINDVAYGGIYGIGRLTPNNRTYNELSSTGNISLISDQDIRDEIVAYYLNLEFLYEYGADSRSDYPHFMNSYKVFNPKFPDSVSPAEIPILLKMMRKDKFYQLTNSELTYAYSILNRLEYAKKDAALLYQRIEKYLNNHKTKE